MWGVVLGWALVMALNPLIVGAILLVTSRPRPTQNLLAFWVGTLIVNVPAILLPLILLHSMPTFATIAIDWASPPPSSSVQPLQLGMGVLALSIAAVMIVRRWVRQRANLTTPGGNSSTLVLDSNTPGADSRPLGRIGGAAASVESAIRRLLARGRDEWAKGSLWISLVFGMGYLPPPPVLLVAISIVGSEAAIGTQVIAAIVFVIVMLAGFEIALVSYLLAPARTQALVRPVHEWVEAHRRQVLLAIFTVVGIWQLATGLRLI